MLLLKTAPQDLPYSPGLMNRIIFLYMVSGLVVQSGVVEPLTSIGQMVLNLVVTMVFTYVILSSLELKARFVQTMSSLVGVSIVFNLLAWPLIRELSKQTPSESQAGIITLFVLSLLAWELLVMAHIYRHALNTNMVRAIILSVGLFIISITLSQMVFPEPGK